MTESRKQFEEWYQADIVNWELRFHRDDKKKGAYSFSGTEKAWKAWEASRAAMKGSGK